MRRSLLLFLACAVALAPAADAGPQLAGVARSGKIELVDGTGKALFSGRGVILGRFEQGRLLVVDRPKGAKTTIKVTGQEKTIKRNARVTIYTGKDVSFSIVRGFWRAEISGKGINASASLRGTVRLRGTGTYAIDGPKAKVWPKKARTFKLGA